MVPPRWPDEQGRLLPTRPCQMQAACYSGNQMPLSRGLAVRWVLAALTMALIVWLFAACAAARGLRGPDRALRGAAAGVLYARARHRGST